MSFAEKLLHAANSSRPEAAAELLPALYKELRSLAASQLAKERPGHTLSPTGLVHEAYVRLVANADQPCWEGRGHFFAAAAQAMRRILVETARRKRSVKRGGGTEEGRLGCCSGGYGTGARRFAGARCGMSQLAKIDPAAAQLVELRFFAGLKQAEAAEAMGIPVRSADRLWAYARAWLKRATPRRVARDEKS